ncbi:coproporphyrinogen III oxidase [Heterostelium album PN500]|uniref:coproporphyrinogen oxidase n=1 Tax=Heterostelium pallidum (strain ATCC 26659 / Pp 5 / PN500) TaxID=670386 RepID=D3BUX6_HETP5|nr:coproporphyrinogen III oxidase [Heterostelium album PN500]EFA74914.1 coproporphyrinogen III oxidase [Heterostelium album PN500]|eukprot:XP_020427048.1 coproporphyrinogen III oxidase [Heterostelium album PN500]
MSDNNEVVTVEEIKNGFKTIQNNICSYLVEHTKQEYLEDLWDYHKGTGGGITRVWEGENPEGFFGAPDAGRRYDVLEKGGVNFSCIEGDNLPSAAATQFNIAPTTPYVATGVSLVLHSYSPRVPTIHMNVRYFQAGATWWFGGGIDVTPVYPNLDQVVAYHRGLKAVCDQFGCDEQGTTYAKGKAECDSYFHLKHRNETRGVGGLFYDHIRGDSSEAAKRKAWRFIEALGLAFVSLYRPFLEENISLPYTLAQREFQLYRRSRYVEFNLLFDRGTKFGIQSEGRIESIFMSLPAVAKWKYNYKPQPNTPESELTDFFLKPQDWLSLNQ